MPSLESFLATAILLPVMTAVVVFFLRKHLGLPGKVQSIQADLESFKREVGRDYVLAVGTKDAPGMQDVLLRLQAVENRKIDTLDPLILKSIQRDLSTLVSR